MSDVESIPLPRWAEISRSTFRLLAGVWSVVLFMSITGAAIRRLTGHANYSLGIDQRAAQFVFLVLVVIPACASGMLWLAGEVVRGSRQPS